MREAWLGGWSELPLDMLTSWWPLEFSGMDPGCQSQHHDGKPGAEGAVVSVGSAVESRSVSGARKMGMLTRWCLQCWNMDSMCTGKEVEMEEK